MRALVCAIALIGIARTVAGVASTPELVACAGKQESDRCYWYDASGSGTSSFCSASLDRGLVCGAPIMKTGFYFVLGCYVMSLLGIAAIGYFQIKQDTAVDEEKAYASHFLGSKSLGWFLGFMTLFSTIYSGYTINGVPSEAASLGFYSVRWLTSVVMVQLGSLIIIPRLRRISVARNHCSPNDLVTDRYNNRVLTFLNFFFLSCNNWIYCVAQLYTLNSVFEIVTDGIAHTKWVIWGFTVLILTCEFLGGFRSVAYSDALQSSIMIFAMVAIACVYQHDFGGMAGVTEANCENQHIEVLCAKGVCANSTIGCLYNIAPHQLLHPATGTSEHFAPLWQDPDTLLPKAGMTDGTLPAAYWGIDGSQYYNFGATRMFSFNLLFFAFILNPHWTTRIMAVKSDASVKKMELVFAFIGLLVTLPGIVEGIVAKAEYNPPAGNAGFGVIVNNLMAQGGFRMVIGIFACCASMAAIMSTTDSSCLTISNMATQDILRNGIGRKMTQTQLANSAKWISAVVMLSACAFALYFEPLYDKADTYSKLINFQNTLLWQLVPTSVCALYFERPSPWALVVGIISGTAVGVACVFGVQFNNEVGYGSPQTEDELYFDGGVWGALTNVVVVFILSFILPKSIGEAGPHFPEEDLAKFGKERLTQELIGKNLMAKTVEPIFNKTGAFCMIGMALSCNLCLPWWGTSYNGCTYGWSNYAGDTTNTGLPTSQEGCEPEVMVNGLPQWFVACIAGYMIGIVLNFVAWLTWETQDEDEWFGSLTGDLKEDGAGDVIKSASVEMTLNEATDADAHKV